MKNGKKVFIAGSRRLAHLDSNVKRRIDNIVDRGLIVIVGDANGADKAVQKYLDSCHYLKVKIFCMEGVCRNNIGRWPTQAIVAADPSRHDFAYYSTKDREMVREADYGLMLWDGRSRGTLRSIVDLVREGKSAVVYLSPTKTFWTLRQSNDLAEMLSQVDPAALNRIDPELKSLAVNGGSTHKNGLPLF